MKTRLIVIDGLDGCGKETQTKLLYKYLTEGGYIVKRTSFPRHGEMSSALVDMYLHGMIAEDPNDVNAYAASMCYSLDRYISYMREWKNWIGECDYILLDRYTSANTLFQSSKVYNKKEFIEWVYNIELNKFGLPVPDIELYLVIDPRYADVFMNNRKVRDVHENLKFQQQVYYNFFSIRKYFPEFSHIVECCTGTGKDTRVLSINEIHSNILDKLRENNII